MSTDEPSDLEACFKRGMAARAARRKLADNPYNVRTPQHREWAAGWAATFDLDEDDDPESTRVKPGKTDKDAEESDDDPGTGPLNG